MDLAGLLEHWNINNGIAGQGWGRGQGTFFDISIINASRRLIHILKGHLTLIFIGLCYGRGRVAGILEVKLWKMEGERGRAWSWAGNFC